MINGLRIAVAIIAAGGILAPAALSQMVPGTEPVPADSLNGRSFRGPDSSFSVDAPTDEWQWLRFVEAEKAVSGSHPELRPRTYMLYHAATRTAFAFSVLTDSTGAVPNEQFMRGLQSGVERTSVNAGWTIKDFAFERSEIPIRAKSYRYHSKAVRADGTVRYRFGYIGGTGKKYQFSYSDSDDKEEALFTSVVSSFREGNAGQ